MELRKDDILWSFGRENDLQVEFRKHEPLDFTKAQLLPDLRHALSRVYTLKSENHPEAVWAVAKELWCDWIYINLPPVTEINIRKKLEKQLPRIEKLKRTHLTKRGPSWEKEVRQLLVDMDNGMDLRSWHKASIEVLTEEFEIAVGEDEELLYADNCVPGDDGKCDRKRVCAGEDQVWLKDADQRKLQLEKIDDKFKRRNARIKADKAALAAQKVDTPVDVQALDVALGFDDQKYGEDVDPDEIVKVHSRLRKSKVVQDLSSSPRETRSSSPSFSKITAK